MRAVVRLAAATVLVAAAGAFVQSPASAAACATADGVTVVVDFNQLGGGVPQACVTGGGGANAAELFAAASHELARVQQQPGFVCRVDGLPTEEEEACVRTPPADAYWGLWWSNGDTGTWTYASEGVDSLTVPDGGSVALSWNGSSTRSQPSATPPDHSQEPAPSPTPSSGGGATGAGTGDKKAGQPLPSSSTPTGQQSASPQARAESEGRTRDRQPRSSTAQREERAREQDRPEERARERDRDRRRDREAPEIRGPTHGSAPAGADVTSEPVAAPAGGLPAWVAPTAIGALFAVAGVAAYVRRRAA